MEKKEIKISDKQIKIIAVITILIIVFIVLFWGMAPGKIYDVSEIISESENFDGRNINVSGIVNDWISTSNNFTLVDSFKENFSIHIVHTRGFPGGFANNETVVVTGIYFSDTEKIESQSIQIGCPSKY